MQVISGPAGREHVHFEAPKAERLDSETKAGGEALVDLGGDVHRAEGVLGRFPLDHPAERSNSRRKLPGRPARLEAGPALC